MPRMSGTASANLIMPNNRVSAAPLDADSGYSSLAIIPSSSRASRRDRATALTLGLSSVICQSGVSARPLLGPVGLAVSIARELALASG